MTVQGKDGKRWRVLPDLKPPRTLEELESIRRAAIYGRRGGGVPLAQLEPDPFNLHNKICSNDWNKKITPFKERPRTSSPKQQQQLTSNDFSPMFVKNGREKERRPITSPLENILSMASSETFLRPMTSIASFSSSSIPHSHSVPTLLQHPIFTIDTGTMDYRSSQDPFSAARPSTTESNNGRTHLKLHVDANRIPPGGFRQRPTSRGVISTIGGHNFPGIRPKVCKREYYEVPDHGGFQTRNMTMKKKTATVIKKKMEMKKKEKEGGGEKEKEKEKHLKEDTQDQKKTPAAQSDNIVRSGKTGGGQRGEEEKEEEEEDDETKPLLLIKRLKKFQLGKKIEIRELNHKFTGLFRPTCVHHIHNTGFLDVSYKVGGLLHYRFHVDPRAARHPPEYLHTFSLSATENSDQTTAEEGGAVTWESSKRSTRNKGRGKGRGSKRKTIEEKEKEAAREKEEKKRKGQLEEKKRLFIQEEEIQFPMLLQSKIISAVRPPSVFQDNILNNRLSTSIHVNGWSNAVMCKDVRVASITPGETTITNQSNERIKKIKIKGSIEMVCIFLNFCFNYTKIYILI